MNILNQIISVQEAAELWGLSPDHVKRLCRDGDVIAKKIGNSWAVLKNQDNPKQRERRVMKIITVEKRKNHDHVIGEEWTREYVWHEPLEFLDEVDLELVDEEEHEAVLYRKNGSYVLENGDFNYYVEIKEES